MLQFTIYFGAEPADGRDGVRKPKSKSPVRQGGVTTGRRLRSLEFAAGSGLIDANAPDGDVGLVIVFTHDGGADEAAEHRDLADVIEGIGNRTLEEASRRGVHLFGRSEVIVEFCQGGKKPGNLGVPRQWRGVVPSLLAFCDGERPVK